MELKPGSVMDVREVQFTFNRTAYGIETEEHDIFAGGRGELLIAPLMELKQRTEWNAKGSSNLF